MKYVGTGHADTTKQCVIAISCDLFVLLYSKFQLLVSLILLLMLLKLTITPSRCFFAETGGFFNLFLFLPYQRVDHKPAARHVRIHGGP